MQPVFKLLSKELITEIIDEAFQLMLEPGIKVLDQEARELFSAAGAQVDQVTDVVRIPESVVREAIKTVPHEFFLYDLAGKKCVQYGGDAVHFDPGSSGVNVLDPESFQHRRLDHGLRLDVDVDVGYRSTHS